MNEKQALNLGFVIGFGVVAAHGLWSARKQRRERERAAINEFGWGFNTLVDEDARIELWLEFNEITKDL